MEDKNLQTQIACKISGVLENYLDNDSHLNQALIDNEMLSTISNSAAVSLRILELFQGLTEMPEKFPELSDDIDFLKSKVMKSEENLNEINQTIQKSLHADTYSDDKINMKAHAKIVSCEHQNLNNYKVTIENSGNSELIDCQLVIKRGNIKLPICNVPRISRFSQVICSIKLPIESIMNNFKKTDSLTNTQTVPIQLIDKKTVIDSYFFYPVFITGRKLTETDSYQIILKNHTSIALQCRIVSSRNILNLEVYIPGSQQVEHFIQKGSEDIVNVHWEGKCISNETQ